MNDHGSLSCYPVVNFVRTFLLNVLSGLGKTAAIMWLIHIAFGTYKQASVSNSVKDNTIAEAYLHELNTKKKKNLFQYLCLI